MSPADSTLYIPSPVSTNLAAASASNMNRQLRTNRALSAFLLNLTSSQTAGTSEGVTVSLHNITKGTSVNFTTSLDLSVTVAAYYTATLACDPNDLIELHFTTPAWVTNPSNWQIGGTLTF